MISSQSISWKVFWSPQAPEGNNQSSELFQTLERPIQKAFRPLYKAFEKQVTALQASPCPPYAEHIPHQLARGDQMTCLKQKATSRSFKSPPVSLKPRHICSGQWICHSPCCAATADKRKTLEEANIGISKPQNCFPKAASASYG